MRAVAATTNAARRASPPACAVIESQSIVPRTSAPARNARQSRRPTESEPRARSRTLRSEANLERAFELRFREGVGLRGAEVLLLLRRLLREGRVVVCLLGLLDLFDLLGLGVRLVGLFGLLGLLDTRDR